LHSHHRTKRGFVASALSHEHDFTDCFEDSLLLEVLDMWNGERDLVFDSWTLPLPASLSCWEIEVLSEMSHALSCSACTFTEQGGVPTLAKLVYLSLFVASFVCCLVLRIYLANCSCFLLLMNSFLFCLSICLPIWIYERYVCQSKI
jgi:hypothetical protein